MAELNLLKENGGVSIIIPRTLVDDRKILEINRLDKIIFQFRKLFLSKSPFPLSQQP